MEIQKLQPTTDNQYRPSTQHKKTPYNRQPSFESSITSLAEELGQIDLGSDNKLGEQREVTQIDEILTSNEDSDRKQVVSLIQYLIRILKAFDGYDVEYCLLYSMIEEDEIEERIDPSLVVNLATAKVGLITALKEIDQEVLEALELDQFLLPNSFANLMDLIQMAKRLDDGFRNKKPEVLKQEASELIDVEELALFGNLVSSWLLLDDGLSLLEETFRHLFASDLAETILEIAQVVTLVCENPEKRVQPLLLLIMFHCEQHDRKEALRAAGYLLPEEFKNATKEAIECALNGSETSSSTEVRAAFIKFLNEKTSIAVQISGSEIEEIVEVVKEGYPDAKERSEILAKGIKAIREEQAINTPQVKKAMTLAKYITDRTIKKRTLTDQFKHHIKTGQLAYAKQVVQTAPFPRIQQAMSNTLLTHQINKKKTQK